MVKQTCATLVLMLLVTGSALARDSTSAVAAGGDAKPSMAAQKSGAVAVVNRFYGWLFRRYSTHYGPRESLPSWATARDLLDGNLFSMLDKNQRSHPRLDPRKPLDEECVVLDLLGANQMYDRPVRFAVGTPSVRSDAVVVPVTSWRSTEGKSPYGFTMSVTVRNEAGRYRIYDVRQLGPYAPDSSIREDLIRNSRNPHCGWDTGASQALATTAPQGRAQSGVATAAPQLYAKTKGHWTAVSFRALLPDDAASYPFLKARIEEVQRTEKSGPLAGPAKVRIAKPRLQNQFGLVLLSISGSFWCGSLGCAVDVYLDEGSGYKQVNGFITVSPMYVSETRRSVVLCGRNGQPPGEYVLKNHTFVWNGHYTARDRPC